jgi:hypothetical protein
LGPRGESPEGRKRLTGGIWEGEGEDEEEEK